MGCKFGLQPGIQILRSAIALVLYIALRYTFIVMKGTISDTEYRALAELRYRIRHFIQDGDAAAQRSSLEPQQYLMLLAIRGLPQGAVATIRTLAERMALKHHSAVELIDRLELRRLVRRSRGVRDKREVRVSLLPQGSKLLDRVVRDRISELKASGVALADAITALVERKHPSPRIVEINEMTGALRRPRISRNAAPRKQNAKPMPRGRKRRA
jgi:DNA-binding MarR family transcriptional regulator